MKKPNPNRTFAAVILQYVEADRVERQLSEQTALAGEKERQARVKTNALRKEAIELWKMEHPDQNGMLYDHVMLPDGKIAHIQEGSITVWEVTKLNLSGSDGG